MTGPKIIIIGSGAFGLSSALHLVETGYENITIFDRLDLFKLGYIFDNGADTASADVNKVFRAYYGDKDHYHRLALKAKDIFTRWDKELKSYSKEEAEDRFNIDVQKIIENSGWLRLDNTEELADEERKSLDIFAKTGIRDTQYVINDPEDVERAQRDGWAHKLDPLKIKKNPLFEHISGVLDSTSGILSASNVCLYVNALLRSKGVNFVTGEEKGQVIRFIESSDGRVSGIVTKDGVEHSADLVILAAGPWSASLLPELGGLSEAHSGNVVLIKVPKEEQALREKFSPKNFPNIGWRLGESRESSRFGGFGIFPISEPQGYVKIISRQKKYLNPVKLPNGTVVSVPLTSNSTPPESRLSKHMIDQVKDFIKVFVPELVKFGIYKTQLLWYTDTINNDFIIDFAPKRENLLVVTGGSGHGFKFLPVLGQFVVDVLEKRENEYTKIFKWRDPSKFNDLNKIGDIKTGKSSFYDQDLSNENDLKFTDEDLERKVIID
ncbi:unnamed protein product [Wickerhamomyces anomalus]